MAKKYVPGARVALMPRLISVMPVATAAVAATLEEPEYSAPPVGRFDCAS